MSYCFQAYLIDSLWTFTFLLDSPLFKTVLLCDVVALATTFRLGTDGIVGCAVLTTAITC